MRLFNTSPYIGQHSRGTSLYMMCEHVLYNIFVDVDYCTAEGKITYSSYGTSNILCPNKATQQERTLDAKYALNGKVFDSKRRDGSSRAVSREVELFICDIV